MIRAGSVYTLDVSCRCGCGWRWLLTICVVLTCCDVCSQGRRRWWGANVPRRWHGLGGLVLTVFFLRVQYIYMHNQDCLGSLSRPCCWRISSYDGHACATGCTLATSHKSHVQWCRYRRFSIYCNIHIQLIYIDSQVSSVERTKNNFPISYIVYRSCYLYIYV
jgi:hypothetical protein